MKRSNNLRNRKTRIVNEVVTLLSAFLWTYVRLVLVMTNPSKARKVNSIKEFSVGTIKEKEVFLHEVNRG